MSARRSALLAALLAIALTAAGPAEARHHGAPHVDHYVLSDGTGQLIANPGGHPVAWERCAPDGSPCTPHDDDDGDPQFLAVLPPAAAGADSRGGAPSSEWRHFLKPYAWLGQ